MDWRGGGGTTEGRRLKSLKMLFTRNSIIDAAAEEEEGEMEVLPSEGAKSAQIPILGYLEGGQNQKITSVGLECFDGGRGSLRQDSRNCGPGWDGQ